MDKFDVGREQLLTALDLFLEDKSPVSVQVLAGNAREILASLCNRRGVKSQSQALYERRQDGHRFWQIVNSFRNAFKHFREGDEEIFDRFSDSDNDHMLFLAIEDYLQLTRKLITEMRAIRNWYVATYPAKLVEEKRRLANEFSYMTSWPRTEQKKKLRNEIDRARLSDVFHEPR
jgi:hypothetical protein